MITEIGAIIEIGIPNKIANLYKNQNDLKDRAKKEIRNFVNNLACLGDIEIEHIKITSVDYIEINDFNYSFYNEVKQNEEYRVLRFFGCSLFTHDTFTLSDQYYWYKMKNFKICLIPASCTTERNIKNNVVKFLGVTNDCKKIL